MLKKICDFLCKKYYFEIKLCYFNLIFSLFTVVAYNGLFFKNIYEINNSPLFLIMVFICLLLLMNIACNILFVKYSTKALSIILTLTNSFVFYFMMTYKTPIDKIMLLNVIQTDIYEAQDLMGLNMFVKVFIYGIFPAFLIYKTKIIYKSFGKELLIKIITILLSGLIVGGIIFSSYKSTAQFLRNNRDEKYVLIPSNYIGAVISVVKIKNKANQKFVTIGDDAKLNKYWKNNGKKNLFVFVAGETARAANFSMNGYDRDTNAPLVPYMKDIAYFHDVKACGTSTAIALPCMFSKYDRKTFKVGSGAYTENALDVVEKIGYRVLWRENNTGCKNNCDRVEIEDFCTQKTCPDEILLRDFKEKVAHMDKEDNKDMFVVMHQQGSHGPTYYQRYPEAYEIYKPACKTEVLDKCSREEIVNVFDNTIYYTSEVLAKTIKELDELSSKYNTVMIYTSDHGESLGENNLYLHAAPYAIAPSVQVQVPMLIWMSDESAKNLNIDKKCLANKVKGAYSHDNIFHSILGLTGANTKEYNAELDIFASCTNKN